MSSDPPARWTDSDSSSSPESLPPLPPPSPAGPDGKGLKGMLADAMAKSRGQGVVQGSTLFFKNLAESVAHSNRNLKIGLAFLMAAFVVVTSGLGYLVYQAFQTQEATKASLEDQLKGVDEKTKKALEPIFVAHRELQDKVARMESEMAAVRLTAAEESDAARREVAALRSELEATRKQAAMAYEWMEKSGPTIQGAFKQYSDRLTALENRR